VTVDQEPPAARRRSRTRLVVQVVLSLVLVVAIFYFLRRKIDPAQVWAAITAMTWLELSILGLEQGGCLRKGLTAHRNGSGSRASSSAFRGGACRDHRETTGMGSDLLPRRLGTASWPHGGPAGGFGSGPCGSDKAQVFGHRDDQALVAVAWARHADHYERVLLGPAQPHTAAEDPRGIVLAGRQHCPGPLNGRCGDQAFAWALKAGPALGRRGDDRQGAVAVRGADGAERDHEVLGEHQQLPVLAGGWLLAQPR
jgi:hypothetical protein